DLLDLVMQFLDGHPPAGCYVAYVLTGGIRVAGEQVRSDTVFHEGKIARLCPIPMDDGGNAIQRRRDEPWDDGSVGGVGILAWTVHVEVAQGDRREPGDPTEHPTEMLPGQLCDGIR